MKYDVVLSPAVKKAPKLTDASPAPTEEEINRKLKDAEERRISLDNLRCDHNILLFCGIDSFFLTLT